MKNVVILTMARARSSMVTRIFVDHGWNPGQNPKKADQWNRSGYWEHMPLKQYSKGLRGNSYKCILANRDPRLHDLPVNYFPQPPWVLKADAFCHPALVSEETVVVKLKRDREAIVRSCLKTPFMRDQGFTRAEWEQIVDAHIAEMEEVPGLWVDTDILVMRDHREIRAAIEAAGGTYNPDLTSSVLNI